MDIEVRHLRMISAIAQTGSISRAAAHLGYTQPALTAQLQRIERSLGGKLFDRDGTGARPTALGSVVVSHAGNMLSMHEDLMRDVHRRGTDALDTSSIRLGSTANPLTAALVTAAGRLLPNVEVSLRVSDTEEEQLELLGDGLLEFGLAVDYPGYQISLPPGLSRAVVSTGPVFVLLGASHRLASLPDVPLRELADEHWMPGEGKDARMRAQFRAACQDAGFTPRRVQRMNGAVTFPMVAQGHGVSLAHALTIEREGAVVRPLAGDPMWVRQLLVWPTHGPLAVHAETLRETLAADYRSLAARSAVYTDWMRRRGRDT